jgi:KDO2-lipid IV(A) lauroyltransferase
MNHRLVKRIIYAVISLVALSALQLARRVDANRVSDFAGWLTRTFAPLLPENRVARDNLRAAFPEKSTREIESILRASWENLGRLGGEMVHLNQLLSFDANQPERGRIKSDRECVERFLRLAHDGKPALLFAAHLGNWELPAVAAAAYGIESMVLYRKPNVPGIDHWLREMRGANMGELVPAGIEAPRRLAEGLARGAHVGMLVDQYFGRGVEVTFFGRKTTANPLLARLARHFDCPIHGVRMIRESDHTFRVEITEEVKPKRDAEGKIDIAGTMQIITSIVEAWVREYPEQWLWQHRRWR